MTTSDRQKEQIRLRANYVNGLAIGTFTAGVLTPLISGAVLHENLTPDSAFLAVAAAAVCFALSFALHSYASRHLRELD